MTAEDDLAFAYVGHPDEVVRAVDAKCADQARKDFELYVRRTLSFNQRAGGRFNPPCEFGALYTASDEQTAWAELHARFRREGVEGLPPWMGLIRITVGSGRYVDLGSHHARDAWGVATDTLQTEDPSPAQREACWQLGRGVRVVADFLKSPSARASGYNIPLFIAGREDCELTYALTAADPRRITPEPLRQKPAETWD